MSNIETYSKPQKGHRLFCDPCELKPRERELLLMFAKHGGYRGVIAETGLNRRTLHEKFGIIRSKLGVKTNEDAVAKIGATP